MSRTSEMKLHYVTRDGVQYECFYDTHIRLWTALIAGNENWTHCAGYGISKEDAVGECIANNA